MPVTPGGFPFYMYGNDLFSQPPPAHMGLTPWPLGGSHSSGAFRRGRILKDPEMLGDYLFGIFALRGKLPRQSKAFSGEAKCVRIYSSIEA